MGQSKSLLIADYYYSSKKYELAQKKYEKSLNKHSNKDFKESIYFHLGECNRILHDTIIAEYYNQCIDLNKKSTSCKNSCETLKKIKRISYCYFYLKEYERAERNFKMYYRVKKDDYELNKFYMQCLTDQGKQKEANEIRNEMIETFKSEVNK